MSEEDKWKALQKPFDPDEVELLPKYTGPKDANGRIPRDWIGYIFLDDFGRTKPAFLNSTGVMYPSVECILKLLYQCT